MWPWEHAIVGYLAYSACCHLYYRDAPGGPEALAVVFASVLPDLIDKPLAWEFGVFDAGYALGHSIFFAVPLAITAGIAARSYGRQRAGIAFGIGYLLHLPADVIDGVARRGVLSLGILLWPLVAVEGDASVGFGRAFIGLFGRYRSELIAGQLSTYVTLQLAVAALTVIVWLYDGAPVLREIVRTGRHVAAVAVEDGPR